MKARNLNDANRIVHWNRFFFIPIIRKIILVVKKKRLIDIMKYRGDDEDEFLFKKTLKKPPGIYTVIT
jgi:hypothetical protein